MLCLPGLAFVLAQDGRLVEQGANAVAPDLCRRMQPAKEPDSGEAFWQNMLEKAADQFGRFQRDGLGLAGLGVAVAPEDFAGGQLLQLAIGGGGLEDVTSQVTEGLFARADSLVIDNPLLVPDSGGQLGQRFGRLFLEGFAEEVAKVIAQRPVMKQELSAAGDPLALVQAQAPAGNQVMDVRVEDERARPCVQDAEHAQLSAQAFGICGQILESLRACGKEQFVTDLLMGADPGAERIGHGEGDQKIRRRQQQTLASLLKPMIGVGGPAERAMPIIAGMIAVVELPAVRAAEEFSAQGRSAAAEDAAQDLALTPRHGGVKLLQILRTELR
jgi:hypothetical protein